MTLSCLTDQEQSVLGNVTNGFGDGAGGVVGEAQTFTPSVTDNLCSFETKLRKVLSPTGTLVLDIYTDGDGQPGSLVATSSNSYDVSTIASSPSFTDCSFDFSNSRPLLTAETTYWAIYRFTTAISGGWLVSGSRNVSGDSDPYTRGKFYNTTNGGTFTNDDSVEFGNYIDWYFKQNYIVTSHSPSPSPSASPSQTPSPSAPDICSIDQAQSNGQTQFVLGEPYADLAQTFKPSISAKICTIKIRAVKDGSPTGSLRLFLLNDDNGQPGTLIGVSSNSYDVSTFPQSSSGNYEVLEFEFFDSNIELTAETTYWFLISEEELTFSNIQNSVRIFTLSADIDPYPRGNEYIRLPGTTEFITEGFGFNFSDVWFEEYYVVSSHSPSASESASSSLSPSSSTSLSPSQTASESPSSSQSPSASVSPSASPSTSPSASWSPSSSASPSPPPPDMVIAVAKEGVNAVTATDPNDFIYHSSYNTFKILYEGSGTITYTADGRYTFSHGYTISGATPHSIFIKFPDGYTAPTFGMGSTQSQDLKWIVFDAFVDETDVSMYVKRVSGTDTSLQVKYYIYEDPL